MNILYEDKNIISLVKSAGYLCEESENKPNLVSLIREHLANNNCNKEVFVVHRLDVLTSGVMVYAKTKTAAGRLGNALNNHEEFLKEYLTIVEGVPKEIKGTYCDLLFKDSKKNKSYVVKRMRKGVKEAKLEYEVLAHKIVDKKDYSLLKIRLFTGRTHQIRVQLSSRKMPVLGDGKYGSSNSNCELALFSHCLCFTNPSDDKKISLKALPDFEKYPWNIFLEEKEKI